MASTQTKKDIVAAVATTLKNTAAVTNLLGAGVDSVFQYQDEKQLQQAIRNNKKARTPALCITTADEDWDNEGNTHDRKPAFIIYTLVYDPVGFLTRQSTADDIMEQLYLALIDSTLGLTNPIINPVQPGPSKHEYDMVGRQDHPLEISVFSNAFNTAVEWYP